MIHGYSTTCIAHGRMLVNQNGCKVQHAFQCFRGIPIGAGANLVELRYEPGSFFTGLWISLSGLGVWLTMFIVQRQRTETPAQ